MGVEVITADEATPGILRGASERLSPAARAALGRRLVVAGVTRLLDPTRELRAAQDALDVAATPDNQWAAGLFADLRARRVAGDYHRA